MGHNPTTTNNKDISIGGKGVITDWKNARIVSPDNLQKQVKANEGAKTEIVKQKEIAPTSSNVLIGVVC